MQIPSAVRLSDASASFVAPGGPPLGSEYACVEQLAFDCQDSHWKCLMVISDLG